MLIISIQFSSPYNNISVPIQCDNFLIDLAFNLLVKESVFFVAAFPPNLFSIASINSLASLIELNFNCGSLGSNDAKHGTEDLFRPSNAIKMRVNVSKEIINFLRETEEQYFYFPWSMDGTFVYNNFWQGLLGISKERRETDWAIVGPFFNTFMLRNELSCCYADSVTYGVPWFAQFVKKVYFPINVEEVHWILSELHIRSGVVTFYDSLPPNDLTVENKKWWLDMRACYAYQIPTLLLKIKVLDKKNIDPANYSITYRYAVNVPRQGDAYGDCDSVMSDSDESGVTYTEVSSPFEGLSDIGSLRADDHEYLELPWMPEDPYVEAALQAPPSPDYVPGPEEPEQAPPSPDYVPGPKHADDEIVAEDQPYAEDASPTAQSPDYVPESDLEADPEEDDD
ncbi:ulp1 protease family, C-terminal catalytic domain-containing protein [Tanacetum coccineum]